MKKILFFFLCSLITLGTYAQGTIIRGIVTSADDNQPLPGVSVVIKGTTTGTVTDIDGQYQLQVPADAVLIYSFVGMQSQEIPVDGRSEINVALESAAFDVDEVVVVGYGVQRKALTTGANVNVKGEEIAALNPTTAMEALQGITPGVSITRNSGQPGAGTEVVIRGMGTIGNSSPLYIVDGVATGNIDFLNPSDIESIDVLKDAASAAIYGSRAANGVVLVTTVKGQQGRKPVISYDAYYGVQNIYKNVAPLNAQEYMFIMDEGRINDGRDPHNWENVIKNNSWLTSTYGNELGTRYGEEIWEKLQNGWEGTNWIDEMSMENAPVQSHALNIAGGTQDAVYSLGVSYLDQSGIMGGDITDAGYKRMTARMNTEFTLVKSNGRSIVKVGENFTYTNTRNRSVATGNIYWNDLHNAILQHPLMPAYWDQSPDQHGFSPTLDGLDNGQTNPLAVMYYRHNYNWSKGNKVTGNAFAEITPIPNLVLRSSFGVDAWFGNNRSWAPTYGLGVLYRNTNDAAEQSMYFGNNWTWTNTISYDFDLGEHSFNALVGNEFYKNQINMEVGGRMANTRFGSPEYAFLNNVDKTDISSISTWGADWATGGGGLMSYIGRLQYDFREKYLLSATVRADGSSNFAKGHRWGTFPSVSAGWIFSEEAFMDGTSSIVDFAKLRASWGQNGNQAIDNFIYSSTIAYTNPGYFYGDDKLVSAPTAYPENIPNPDVTWETSEQLNIGIDSRFFDQRLMFTFDWYKKTTKDWLVVAPIQGTFGAGAPWINGGDINNTGVELSLGWNDQIRDFNYGITVNGAHNKNEVTRIANAEGIIHGPSHVLSQGTASISRVEVGYPIGYFYGLKTDGILQNQEEVDAYVGPDGNPYFDNQRPGDVRFVDQNNDGVINDNDKVMLGDPNPDFELGVQLNAEYKGFYMNSTLTGKFGMQVMRSYRSFADKFYQNYTTEIFDRWYGEGTSTRLPRLSSSSHHNTNLISDIYLHDADYLRINNLTVGYDFNKLLSGLDFVSQARLYVSVSNLYTFTKYDGMDPEVSFGHDANWASGIDLGLYPQARTVMFGASITF